MRRQKRDQSSRAFNKGYTAGVLGKSKEMAPQNPNLRHSWLCGWREGRSDQWDGMTGVSGVHKIPL